jgi:hypothetical protein
VLYCPETYSKDDLSKSVSNYNRKINSVLTFSFCEAYAVECGA